MPNSSTPPEDLACPARDEQPPVRRSDSEGGSPELENLTELLHLWVNEAHAYRLLVEALITGRYTKQQAKQALERSYNPQLAEGLPNALVTPEPSNRSEGGTIPNTPETNSSDVASLGTACFGPESLKCRSARYTIHLVLSEPEHQALTQLANQTNLTPHQLLWTALDCLMNSRDDPDVLRCCQQTTQTRFQQNTFPEWIHTQHPLKSK